MPTRMLREILKEGLYKFGMGELPKQNTQHKKADNCYCVKFFRVPASKTL